MNASYASKIAAALLCGIGLSVVADDDIAFDAQPGVDIALGAVEAGEDEFATGPVTDWSNSVDLAKVLGVAPYEEDFPTADITLPEGGMFALDEFETGPVFRSDAAGGPDQARATQP